MTDTVRTSLMDDNPDGPAADASPQPTVLEQEPVVDIVEVPLCMGITVPRKARSAFVVMFALNIACCILLTARTAIEFASIATYEGTVVDELEIPLILMPLATLPALLMALSLPILGVVALHRRSWWLAAVSSICAVNSAFSA